MFLNFSNSGERETIAPLAPPGSAGHAGGIILPAQWLWRMGDGYLTLIMSALVPPVCTSLEMQMLANVNKTPPNFKNFLYSSPYHNIHNEATVLWINVSSVGLWIDRVIRINLQFLHVCNFFTFSIFHICNFHICHFSHLQFLQILNFFRFAIFQILNFFRFAIFYIWNSFTIATSSSLQLSTVR